MTDVNGEWPLKKTAELLFPALFMILLNSLMHICVETRPIVHDGKMPFCQSLLKSKEHFPWRFANGTTRADREKGAFTIRYLAFEKKCSDLWRRSRATLRWRTLHCCAAHHHNQSQTCSFHKLYSFALMVKNDPQISDFLTQISDKYIQWKSFKQPTLPSTLQCKWHRCLCSLCEGSVLLWGDLATPQL